MEWMYNERWEDEADGDFCLRDQKHRCIVVMRHMGRSRIPCRPHQCRGRRRPGRLTCYPHRGHESAAREWMDGQGAGHGV